MSESSWKEEAARQSSQWLDTDEQPSIPDPETSANREYLEHVADLQLVDALLASMSEPAISEKENRIRAVMDAIDPPSPARTLVTIRFARATLTTVVCT